MAFPKISFAGMGKFEPHQGGVGMVPREGVYAANVLKLEPHMSKDGTKLLGKVSITITDEDAIGTVLMTDVNCTGVDKNRDPMVRQFCEFACSTGTPKETIQQYGAQNFEIEPEVLFPKLVGRPCYARVKYNVYQGELQSKITGWATKEEYETLKANKGHRGIRMDQVNIQQMIATQAQGNAGGNGAGAGAGFGGQPGAFTPSAPNLGGQPTASVAPGAPGLGNSVAGVPSF